LLTPLVVYIYSIYTNNLKVNFREQNF